MGYVRDTTAICRRNEGVAAGRNGALTFENQNGKKGPAGNKIAQTIKKVKTGTGFLSRKWSRVKAQRH